MAGVNAGLVVAGLIDGTTIFYDIAAVKADGTPISLAQYFDETKCRPDWADIWSKRATDAASLASLPRIVIRAYDTSIGIDITHTVNITSVYYNGSLVSWDRFSDDESISTDGLLLKLNKESDYAISYKGNKIQGVMMVGNPADAQYNPDDDRISFDGTVVSQSGQISFSGLGKDIAIRQIQDTYAGYSVEMLVPLDVPKFIMTDSNNAIISTKRIATLYYNGTPVTAANMTGFQFKFYDITGPTEVELTNAAEDITIGRSLVPGDMITIGPKAVDCLMTVRCKVLDAEGNELCSGTTAVYDLSDPYSVKWVIADDTVGTNSTELTGIEPRLNLRNGQTKYIFPKLCTEKGDTFPAGSSAAGVTWQFNADDATTGESVSLPGVPTAAGQTYCSIGYSDVVLATAGSGKIQRPVALHAQSSEF